MNKKEKKLIEMFEEANNIALKNCDGSIWAFVGSLEASLAYEAVGGERDIKRMDKALELIEKLKEITKNLH